MLQIKQIKCIGGQTKEEATSFAVVLLDNTIINIVNVPGAKYLDEILNWGGEFEAEFFIDDIKQQKLIENAQLLSKYKNNNIVIMKDGITYYHPDWSAQYFQITSNSIQNIFSKEQITEYAYTVDHYIDNVLSFSTVNVTETDAYKMGKFATFYINSIVECAKNNNGVIEACTTIKKLSKIDLLASYSSISNICNLDI
jgi:hypothetical protein